MTSALPARVDLMPREREPTFTPRELIAFALSAIPYRWSGRALSETSQPVDWVLEALRRGGYEIVPIGKERS